MSKKITGLASALAVVAVAYTGASWWLGLQVEQQSKQIETRTQALFGQELPIRYEHQRGIFSSERLTTVELDWPALDGQAGVQAIRIVARDRITHGPLPGLRLAAAQVQSELLSVEGVPPEIRQLFAQVPAPSASTTIGFNGDMTGTMHLPAGEFRLDEGKPLQLRWQALTQDFRMNPEQTEFKGEFRLPQLEAELGAAELGGTLRLSLNQLRSRLDWAKPQAHWVNFLGQTHTTASQLKLDGPGGASWLDLQDIRIDSNDRQQGTDYLFDTQLKAQGQIGGLAFKALAYEKHWALSQNAMDQLQVLLMQLVQLRETPDDPAQLLATFEAPLRELLGSGIRWSTRLEASTDEGTATLDGSAELQGDARWTERPMPTEANEWGEQLLEQLQAEAKLHLPKSWLPLLAQLAGPQAGGVEQLGLMADSAVAEGWLSADDTAYSTLLTFKNKTPLINGKALH